MATIVSTLNSTDDRRIQTIKPLIPPQILMEDLPLSSESEQCVERARLDSERVICGEDDDGRIIVVVGPCSIHDPDAARDYAARLKKQAKDHLVIIMRVYFEKPRTSVGWKGLINDPMMDDSFLINKGLKIARGLLLDINNLGIPTGCEYLDTLTPQYIGDLCSWGAIGARTTESQVHRELASGLSVPVGFKNGTDGNVAVAIDAIRAASAGHHFLSVTKQGLSAIVATTGNQSCHVILRGGKNGPNYSSEHVQDVVKQLGKAMPCIKAHVMIDCSHGNSSKQHRNQIKVVDNICEQLCNPITAESILGVMIESNINEGRQDLDTAAGKTGLKYGVSVTDACINWSDTIACLEKLSAAVQVRRSNKAL